MKKKKRVTFAGWIRDYGVRALARELNVHPTAVSKWALGKSQPTLDHATAILALAGGALTAADLRKGGAA